MSWPTTISVLEMKALQSRHQSNPGASTSASCIFSGEFHFGTSVQYLRIAVPMIQLANGRILIDQSSAVVAS